MRSFCRKKKPMSIKFLIFGGGGILGLRGGCRFYFYGRADFSDLNRRGQPLNMIFSYKICASMLFSCYFRITRCAPKINPLQDSEVQGSYLANFQSQALYPTPPPAENTLLGVGGGGGVLGMFKICTPTHAGETRENRVSLTNWEIFTASVLKWQVWTLFGATEIGVVMFVGGPQNWYFALFLLTRQRLQFHRNSQHKLGFRAL